MADRQLFSNHLGLKEYIHYNSDAPGDLIIETVQDCEPVIAAAKRMAEQTPGKEWRHVACVPLWFLDKAAKEGWLHDRKKWLAFLNDPDHKAFRTWPGHLGPSRQV